MIDHDQQFKMLLKEFLEDFFRLFFPEWANRFDFSRVEWLEQEVFPDPPKGRRRSLDLVAKLPTREPVGTQALQPEGLWVSLIHVEIGSGESAVPQREYMFRSHTNLRDRHGLPVLPVALYLNVGLEGIGIDCYAEDYGPLDVLRFKFLYVGLPALDGVEYLEKGNDLGVALAALMKVPPDRRAWFKAEALERLARAARTEQQKFLLSECVQTYLPLERPEEQQEFEQLMTQEEYREAKTMAVTFFEKGLEQGLEQGRRELLALQLEARFGTLTPQVRERLAQCPSERLKELAQQILHASSLRELGLED